MSVNVATAADMTTYAQNAQTYLGDLYDLPDLFCALHAAQHAAYALTYGEGCWADQFSNRAKLERLDAPTMTAAELLDELYHLDYNTGSNGGTDCLPAKYRASLTRVQRALAVVILSDPANRDAARVGHVQLRNSGDYGVFVTLGHRAGATMTGKSGTEYKSHHQKGTPADVLAHAEAINADLMAAYADEDYTRVVVEYRTVTEQPQQQQAQKAPATVPTDALSAYTARLACPLKRQYAQALTQDPAAPVPAGLSADRAADVAAKVARYKVS